MRYLNQSIILLLSISLLSMVGLAEDDMFTKKHSVANKSFIKSMAKNRAYTGVEGASYTKIDDDEEFKKAMKSGALNQESTGSRIQKQFKYIEMNNVRINRNDLINSQEKDLTIGTRVQSEREKIMQAIEIKNSKIKTDKELNVGVVSSSDKVSGITSVNTIDRSELEGGSNQDRSSIMRQEEISLGDQ